MHNVLCKFTTTKATNTTTTTHFQQILRIIFKIKTKSLHVHGVLTCASYDILHTHALMNTAPAVALVIVIS